MQRDTPPYHRRGHVVASPGAGVRTLVALVDELLAEVRCRFSGTNAAQGLLPQGILESLVWIPVALSAGFCEEVAIRGYLQNQFRTIVGSAGWAVLFQAIVFGVGVGGEFGKSRGDRRLIESASKSRVLNEVDLRIRNRVC